MEESTINKQIERAEKTALRLASDSVDDPDNYYWKKVEMLTKKQEAITSGMSELNNNAYEKEKGNVKKPTSNPTPIMSFDTSNMNESSTSIVLQESLTSLSNSANSNSSRHTLQNNSFRS